jgi:hypothetical protein
VCWGKEGVIPREAAFDRLCRIIRVSKAKRAGKDSGCW